MKFVCSVHWCYFSPRYLGDDEEDLDGKDNLKETQSRADDILKKLHKQARLKQRKKQNRSKSDEINESETQPTIGQYDTTNKTSKKVKVKSDQEKNSVDKKGKKTNKSKFSPDGDDGDNELSAKIEGQIKRKKSSSTSSLSEQPSSNDQTRESSFEELPSSKKRKVNNNNDSAKSHPLEVSDREIIGVDQLSYSDKDDDSHLVGEEDEGVDHEEGDNSGNGGEFKAMIDGQAHEEVGGFTVIGDVEQKSVQKVMAMAKIALRLHL